jgi:hypothetical protein
MWSSFLWSTRISEFAPSSDHASSATTVFVKITTNMLRALSIRSRSYQQNRSNHRFRKPSQLSVQERQKKKFQFLCVVNQNTLNNLLPEQRQGGLLTRKNLHSGLNRCPFTNNCVTSSGHTNGFFGRFLMNIATCSGSTAS